jgi:hypothetical protein
MGIPKKLPENNLMVHYLITDRINFNICSNLKVAFRCEPFRREIPQKVTYFWRFSAIQSRLAYVT